MSGRVLRPLPNSLIHPDRNNFSPRVGFAWRPLKKGSLVVRGGYGAYYNTSVYNIIAGNMAQQPPFAQALSVSRLGGESVEHHERVPRGIQPIH